MKPTEGLALGGRYRLVRQIAVGGMGEVWVARDTSLARDVAVKVLREEFAGNSDFLDRLRTEARNSAALSHTNIAQLYDYGEQSGSGYLVMELVVGEPLSDLLERRPVLPPRTLLPILAQTARGLHAAHVAGVVHRDVKPGNILLEHGTTVKITDFGVSLATNQVPMTAAGMVMGTAQYLSPEQAIGRAATGASDIYALGIVAYEATVGHRPFTGQTPVDIAVAHVNETVPPLPTTVHSDLAALIMQMLDKDPTRRPRSGAALAAVLDQLAESIESDPFGRNRSSLGRHSAMSGGSAHSATSVRTAGSPESSAFGAPAAASPATGTAASSRAAVRAARQAREASTRSDAPWQTRAARTPVPRPTPRTTVQPLVPPADAAAAAPPATHGAPVDAPPGDVRDRPRNSPDGQTTWTPVAPRPTDEAARSGETGRSGAPAWPREAARYAASGPLRAAVPPVPAPPVPRPPTSGPTSDPAWLPPVPSPPPPSILPATRRQAASVRRPPVASRTPPAPGRSTSTGLRLGRFSWPSLVLAGILLVMIVAAILNLGAGGDDGADAQEYRDGASRTVSDSLSRRSDDGKMHFMESRPTAADPTTPKDA